MPQLDPEEVRMMFDPNGSGKERVGPRKTSKDQDLLEKKTVVAPREKTLRGGLGGEGRREEIRTLRQGGREVDEKGGAGGVKKRQKKGVLQGPRPSRTGQVIHSDYLSGGGRRNLWKRYFSEESQTTQRDERNI